MRPYPYVVAIIQARLGSQRFPNKMLADLNGHPLLWWSIKRAMQAQTIHQVVVATPDKELHEVAYDSGAWGFHLKEDENNVLMRYIKCANWCDADIIVRITGDCPLIDPQLIDNCVKGYLDNRCDLSTNVFPRSFVRGFDVEVFDKNVLKRIFHLTRQADYLEHVTLFAYRRPELFVIHNISDSDNNSEKNLSVDTMDDLDNVSRFLHHIDRLDFSYSDVMRWLNELDRGRNEEQGRASP